MDSVIPIELRTAKVQLTFDGRLEVYDARLATRINKTLKSYEDGQYTFQQGEEGLFRVRTAAEYEAVRRLLYKRAS